MVIIRENTSDISCSELGHAAWMDAPPSAVPPSHTRHYKLLLYSTESVATRLFTLILPKPSIQKSKHLIVTILHF